ncbi:MAG: hypothetical protein EZS28_003673 [Streblomastix strix]|uniref:Uncharacterized protein n=1 Tax=Streblomastix strix TaxID=222440 RepID=A0A5J4X2W2_9EUKA|nr:MAG: hypothetical protein EZS28_003673 [Streblomastix strix]
MRQWSRKSLICISVLCNTSTQEKYADANFIGANSMIIATSGGIGIEQDDSILNALYEKKDHDHAAQITTALAVASFFTPHISHTHPIVSSNKFPQSPPQLIDALAFSIENYEKLWESIVKQSCELKNASDLFPDRIELNRIPILHQMLNKLIRQTQSTSNLNPYFASRAQPPIPPDPVINEKETQNDPSATDSVTTDTKSIIKKVQKHAETKPLYIFNGDDVWRHLNAPLPLMQTSLSNAREGHEQEKEKRLQQKEQKQVDKSKFKTSSSSQGKELEDIQHHIGIHAQQKKLFQESDDQSYKDQQQNVNNGVNEEVDGNDQKDQEIEKKDLP